MSQKPEKFEAISANITDEQKAKLKLLFPEIVTEGGKIDFDRLKLTLGETVDAGKERYGMNWPGKADCFKTIQRSSMATLVPARDESVNFDTTENLIIEGDNLETLKLLQKAYLGKVKVIYIDPPYNTGNDFIYPDNYSESLETYLRYTGQADEEGRKFSTNTETDGRFHSKWMNMMYPRLFLARNLLRDDGVIFINIDDNEFENLRKICSEIFGEENFVESFIWKSRLGKGATAKATAKLHEYVVCFAKNIGSINFKTDKRIREKEGKERLRQWGQGDRREDRPTMYYPIHSDEFGDVFPKKPDGTDGRWRMSKQSLEDLIKEKLVVFEKQNDGRVEAYRIIPSGDETNTAYSSILDSEIVKTTAHGSIELKDLFGFQALDYPKPVSLIKELVSLNSHADDDSIILDFFAGSGTTAQAVLELNDDGRNRKFILVQLPEPTSNKDFPTIADITKDRVRRVIKRLNEDEANQLDNKGRKEDRGFKVFKLQSSNFKAWNTEQPKDDAELVKQLTLHVDHLVAGRTQEDVLYELLIKSGFPLNTKAEKISLAGKDVFSIADGAMLICLEKELTPEVIKAMAEKKPERVICLDAGFADNDQLKTNAVQTMKSKGVTKFQTI